MCGPAGRGGRTALAGNGEKNTQKRPSGKLTGLILAVLLLGIGVQVYHLNGQLEIARAEQAVYEARRDELLAANQQLAEDIANSTDPELIEEIARNDLGMIGPGEKVFIFNN